MSHGPDLPLPPARTIQGWWRSWPPSARSVSGTAGSFFTTWTPSSKLPAQSRSTRSRALLRAIAGGGTLSPAFDRQVQARLLNGLAAHGLLAAEGPAYRVTPTGDGALATGSFSQVVRRRHSFWFVDNAACAHRRISFCHSVPWTLPNRPTGGRSRLKPCPQLLANRPSGRSGIGSRQTCAPS